ncbi:tRNA (adenosine(37)-N6)-threonylcarbamoyltransferase complex transferase subunit TsaD [Patescibacteria group bacterium]|nr:tRNA (adenosine(37)-N6)-threonylcarbamoyltransferase complex transferase subunit TsaD [Patescibacteria group bacterium]MBU1727838.1 tRNA (adenosine(37)-N6)-threonylcarbamoyltransferase complex transferase subunit TsaD [Patescibacteria group bacterium]
MKILSIETSCDETGVSMLEAKGGTKNPSFKILAESLNSQVKIHAPFGGVYPSLAKREHIKNLPILLERTLKKSNLSKKEKPVDLIAVTYGPGLEPALWTGIVFAKELAKKWDVPLMPVNHMEGHIFSVFGKQKGKFVIPKIKFPIISLLVSGGHTELVLVEDWGKYKIIGETLDDAAGEAFDKVARMLELPYPGGPEISRLASQARKLRIKNYELKIKLPRPMMYSKNFDFSFSGLKTAVLYLIRDLKKENPNILKNEKIKQAIALEFENAVVETLVYKTKKAIEKYNIKTVILAGGVSANKYLIKQLKKITKGSQSFLFPYKKLATDNSIMIGMAGYLKYLNNKKGVAIKLSKIKAEGGLRL